MSEYIGRIRATMRIDLGDGLPYAVEAINKAHGFPAKIPLTEPVSAALKDAHANLRMAREIEVEFWIRKDGTFELEKMGSAIG